MNNYKKLVDEAFDKKSSQLIYNSSKDHAQIIIDKLFNLAENKINLFFGGNDLDAYAVETIQNAFKEKPKLSLDLIIERKNCIDKIKEYFNPDDKKQLTIHCLKEEHIDKIVIEFPESSIEDPDFLKSDISCR